MSRLVRGLWHAEFTFADRITVEPEYAVPYHQAEVFLATPPEGALRGVLRRVPLTRAIWEYIAPFEATDTPRWEDLRGNDYSTPYHEGRSQ